MRLLSVELRRLGARIAIVVVMIVGLAGTALLGLAAYSSAQPMTEQQISEAQRFYEMERENWEENGEQMVADCLDAQEAEAEASGDDSLDYGCHDMEPSLDWYMWEPPRFADFASAGLSSGMLILGLVTLLVGVTFVAAEFASGSMGMWLTFVPRRGRVFISKTTAAAIAGLAFGVVWSTLFLGVTATGYALAGSDVAITAPLIHTLLKVAVTGLAATVVGTGLAFVVRHTAAALGIALGYLIGVDQILLGLVPGGERWTLLNNVTAWTNGSSLYYDEECTVDASGTMCDYVEHTIGQTQGGLVLLGVVVVVTVIAVATFRRRDV